ncbi:MAG: DNA-binding protein [Candidatus Nanohaloarchaea archaeon]|nr:DNA-binding protein [Candidatus Nanohaloarchaea archaeon]
MSDDLDELKKKKMAKMQGNDDTNPIDAQQREEEQMRQKLKKIASQILTDEARSRLGNIRAADEDLAAKIELQLVQLYKAGQIQDEITDEQLKQILQKIQEAEESNSRDIKHR